MEINLTFLSNVKDLTKTIKETQCGKNLSKDDNKRFWDDVILYQKEPKDFDDYYKSTGLKGYKLADLKAEVSRTMSEFFNAWTDDIEQHAEANRAPRLKICQMWNLAKEATAPPMEVDKVEDERLLADNGSDVSDGDGKWLKVERQPHTAKGKSKPKKSTARIEVPVPSFNVNELAVPDQSIKSDAEINPGGAVFPEETVMQRYIYVPQVKRLFDGDKQVAAKDFKEALASKRCAWKVTEDESFIVISSLSKRDVGALRARSLIATPPLANYLANASNEMKEVRTVSYDGSKVDYAEEHFMRLAKVAFYHAQAERHISSTPYVRKLPFIHKWFYRLATVPNPLLAIPVAEKFTWLIKKEFGKSNNSVGINKLLKSFLTGQLATWKEKESRDAFLKRSDAALKFWWGSQADKYKEEFLKTPDGKEVVKPTLKLKGTRLATLLGRSTKSKAVDIMASGLNILQGCKTRLEAIAEGWRPPQEEQDVVNENFTGFWAKARYWSRRYILGIKRGATPMVHSTKEKIGNGATITRSFISRWARSIFVRDEPAHDGMSEQSHWRNPLNIPYTIGSAIAVGFMKALRFVGLHFNASMQFSDPLDFSQVGNLGEKAA